MAFIYIIKNKVNGKIYVGSTIRPMYIRKYEHFSSLRLNEHPNLHLQRSFNKHGEENFIFEVHEYFVFPADYTKEYIIEYLTCREAFLIDSLSADYNQRLQTDRRLAYTHSAETKAKISKSNSVPRGKPSPLQMEHLKKLGEQRKGITRNLSLEARANIAASSKQRAGWRHTPEAIQKISEAGLRRYASKTLNTN